MQNKPRQLRGAGGSLGARKGLCSAARLPDGETRLADGRRSLGRDRGGRGAGWGAKRYVLQEPRRPGKGPPPRKGRGALQASAWQAGEGATGRAAGAQEPSPHPPLRGGWGGGFDP